MEHLSPEEQRLAEQGREAVAAAVAQTRAPLSLRERLEADRPQLWRARRRRGLLLPGVALAMLVVVVAAGLVAGGSRNGTIGGGRAGGPTVLALVSVAQRPPTSPAPHASASKPGSLDLAVDDVAFPYYDDSLPWRPTGARSDLVAGAPTRTVYYRGPRGTQAAYTIVAGSRVPVPDGARTVRRGGTDYRIARSGDRVLVTWVRSGHTCVLSAPAAVGSDALLRLAWWPT
ncbi:MAG: hypothetical protein ACXVFN_01525 [Solirubrobacteraceae bacterium]